MAASRRLVAMIHIARKDLGLSEDAYRAILSEVTGKDSSKDLDERQLLRVVERLREHGWKPKSGKRSEKPAVRMAWALWTQLGTLKALHTPTRAAFRKFCAQLVGVEEVEWMSPEQLAKTIESLKVWVRRVEREAKDA